MTDSFTPTQITNPLTGALAPVVDARATFASATAARPRDRAAEAAFIAARRARLAANPRLSQAEKSALLARFDAAASHETTAPAPDPVPGGIGFGTDFQPAFNIAFTSGTALTYQVICPSTAGGNLSTNLYLTAMNRASLGLEAYVAYFGASNIAEFRIFDWSLAQTNVNNGFQTVISFLSLNQYFIGLGTHGQTFQTLYIRNVTLDIGNGQWVNQAFLFNALHNTWDFIYVSAYNAALADQHNVSFTGFWGPIVETFQDHYSQTNPMGFFQAQMSDLDANGNPVNLNLLTTSNTVLLGPNRGFQMMFLNANFDWAVNAP